MTGHMNRSLSGCATGGSSSCRCRRANSAGGARAAWIVAFPFATRGAPSTTSSRTGMILCSVVNGGRRRFCTPPLTFPSLPGACVQPPRSRLYPEHYRPAGNHQVHRMRDHRQGLGRGMGEAADRTSSQRQQGGGCRIGSSGPRLRPATRSRWPRGCCYEKRDRIGGLLRYGIPDFKMEKNLIDRRMAQMQAEGVEFRPNSQVGGNVSVRTLMDNYDAIVLAGGAEQPRDLPVLGRELEGIHFAMDFLTRQNALLAGHPVPVRASHFGNGQGRRRDWRRGYGIRLRRHLHPPGREIGDSARDHAEAP